MTREELIDTSTEEAEVAWQNAVTGIDSPAAGLHFLARTVAAGLNGVRCAILATVAEPQPAAVTAVEPPLATWAYVELMGHRTLVGYVEEDDLAGRRMLRVRRLQRADRPAGVGEPKPPLELEERWRIYSPASVYSFESISESEARDRYLAMHGIREDRDDDIPF